MRASAGEAAPAQEPSSDPLSEALLDARSRVAPFRDSAFKKFVRLNRRATSWIERHVPAARNSMPALSARYVALVIEAYRSRPGSVLVDVGGGPRSVFARDMTAEELGRVVSTDVTPHELKENGDVKQKLVCDASTALPLAGESAGVIVSSWVMEHLPDVPAFIAEGMRVLQPGGYFVHLLPSRNAPFAVVNRLIPNWLTKRILLALKATPDEHVAGYPAVYDRCTPTELRRSLEAEGFVVERLDVGFYQSHYYDFFTPAYLASVAYDSVVHAAGRKGLASYVLVVARKPAR